MAVASCCRTCNDNPDRARDGVRCSARLEARPFDVNSSSPVRRARARPPFGRYSTLRPSSCRRAQRVLKPRRARRSPRLRAPPPRGARAARLACALGFLTSRCESLSRAGRSMVVLDLPPVRVVSVSRLHFARRSARSEPVSSAHRDGRGPRGADAAWGRVVCWRLSPPQPSRVRGWWCESFSPCGGVSPPPLPRVRVALRPRRGERAPPLVQHTRRAGTPRRARARGGGGPAVPAFASPLFLRPLAARARARRSPRQRRARGARVSREGRPVTHAAPEISRPCGEPPPQAEPEAPCALSRRCALLASFFCLSLVVAPRARRSAPPP